MEIVYLTGLPASGKSTYRKTHFADYAVVSNDEITEELAEQSGLSYDEAWKRLSFAEVYDATLKRFNAAVARRLNIVIDNTNLTRQARALYRAEGYGLKAVVFEIPENERRQREQTRKAAGGKYIPADVIEKMKRSYVPPSFDEGFSEIIRAQ